MRLIQLKVRISILRYRTDFY